MSRNTAATADKKHIIYVLILIILSSSAFVYSNSTNKYQLFNRNNSQITQYTATI